MPNTDDLDDLLARWEDACEQGQDLSAEELCASISSPDLLLALRDQIGALRAMNDRLKTQPYLGETLPGVGGGPDVDLGDVTPEATHRFVIERHLATGGLGTVFIARDEQLQREVVLKFIRGKYANDESCQTDFRTEREITGRMQHPGIVPVYGVGQLADGRPFYAMRYIKGESLKAAAANFHAQREQMSPSDRALQFHKLLSSFVAACRTVAYAHNRGVINRDLKPEHIMLGRYGETLIVDWGLAMGVKAAAAEAADHGQTRIIDPSHSNSSGTGAGTLMFMSPEQAAKADTLAPATDIYSLGATLYVVLTGQLPFPTTGTAADIIQQVIRGDFKPPRALNRHCPKALDAICRKAMAGKVEDRYATAEALAADIERYLADQPVSVLPDTRGESLLRWARRHRGMALTGLVSLISLMLLAMVASLALLQSSNEANDARRASLHTSATFAARMLGREVENRWLALELAADDHELIELLRQWEQVEDKQSGTDPLHARIEAWVGKQRERFDPTFPAFSWSVFDAAGIQVGRKGEGVTHYGKSFAFRAYFHGQERELTAEEAHLARPIQAPSLSPAFQNRSYVDAAGKSHLLTVTCSVPIRDGERIVGVLTMSNAIQAFDALQLQNGEQKRYAMLIDSRPDWKGDRGLVLFYGRAPTAKRPATRATDQPTTLAAETLARVTAGTTENPAASGVHPGFRDPAWPKSKPKTVGYSAVPVRPNREEQPRFSGWIVVVCEANE